MKYYSSFIVFLLWFIKYKKKNISTLLNAKTLFLCKKEAVLLVYLQQHNHGNYHALLYQTIRSAWRFCYIKRFVVLKGTLAFPRKYINLFYSRERKPSHARRDFCRGQCNQVERTYEILCVACVQLGPLIFQDR